MLDRHPFEKSLAQSWSPDRWRDAGVVLAVSGGADSVALLRAMVALCGEDRSPLRVAHVNHALRGAESDGDQQFVEDLCRQFGLPCHSCHMEVAVEAQRTGESLEAAGRSVRYAWLQEVAQQHGAGYVATAHTADDQVETILHRIVRGTGMAGLAGIPRTRALGPAVSLLRPMLNTRRADVIAYLESLRQPFRFDASNADSQHMRNRIRIELLPLLRQNYNPGVDEAISKLGALAADVQRLLAPEVERLREAAVQTTAAATMRIDCRALASADPYLVREVLIAAWNGQSWPLQSMGFAEWEILRSMVQDDGVAIVRTLPGGISARRDASTLTLAPA